MHATCSSFQHDYLVETDNTRLKTKKKKHDLSHQQEEERHLTQVTERRTRIRTGFAAHLRFAFYTLAERPPTTFYPGRRRRCPTGERGGGDNNNSTRVGAVVSAYHVHEHPGHVPTLLQPRDVDQPLRAAADRFLVHVPHNKFSLVHQHLIRIPTKQQMLDERIYI